MVLLRPSNKHLFLLCSYSDFIFSVSFVFFSFGQFSLMYILSILNVSHRKDLKLYYCRFGILNPSPFFPAIFFHFEYVFVDQSHHERWGCSKIFLVVKIVAK
jgi:hypothetical protein